MTITKEMSAELREQECAATPGPWEVRGVHDQAGFISDRIIRTCTDGRPVLWAPPGIGGQERDVAIVVRARNMLVPLLDQVDRDRGQLEQHATDLKATIEWVHRIEAERDELARKLLAMTHARDLAVEILDGLHAKLREAVIRNGGDPEPESETITNIVDVIRAADSTPAGSVSDGYHTFDELYAHRVSLFLGLCAEVDARAATGYVWRSKKHSDGTMFDGWFVMGICTEPGEQITYHLPIERWPDTEWLGTERPTAPAFDGHTSDDVLERLKRFAR